MKAIRRIPVKNAGLAVVEFAVVGLLAFIFLFSAFEFARLMYTWNSLTEGTRRGARVAAVCPLNHTAIANVTIYRSPTGTDLGLGFPGLTTGNVLIEYLTGAGTTTTVRADVAYVRVSITNFQLRLFIPVIEPTITMPSFSTTLPAESLGIVPGSTPQCYGTAS